MATAAEECPFTLVYWPMAGRGDYVRIILSYLGLKWSEKNDPSDVMAHTKQPELDFELMYKAQKAPGGRGIFPCYAPPVLMDHKAGVRINQTHSIQHYLARKHGLLPETEQDIAAAESFNLTVHDFIMEGNLMYHMKDFHDDYLNQKEYTDPFIKEFIAKRLPMYFDYFEKALESKDGNFLFGDKLTYPDFSLYQALRVIDSDQFCDWSKISANHKRLRDFKKLMDDEPKLKEFLTNGKYKLQSYSFM